MLTVDKVGGHTSLLKRSRSLRHAKVFFLASLLDADKLLKVSIHHSEPRNKVNTAVMRAFQTIMTYLVCFARDMYGKIGSLRCNWHQVYPATNKKDAPIWPFWSRIIILFNDFSGPREINDRVT